MRKRSWCFLPALTGIFIGLCGAAQVQAMGLLSSAPTLKQSELTSAELKQISMQSGWSNDDPGLMLFEINNQLNAPVFCIGANFEFKDGKKRSQGFDPKLYVPAQAVRRTSIRGIEKKDVKSYNFSCLCMRASAQGPCEKKIN
jgi:hypothetical protein